MLETARRLLTERGFDATTVQAVAEASGVHASAIYRRWSSRMEIIEQAVFPGLAPVLVAPTGDLRRDLRRFIRAFTSAFGTPAARAAMPRLLASYQAGDRSVPAERWLAVSARPQFVDILRAAPEGAVDPQLDPDDAFDMLLGAVLARTLVPTVAARDRPIERLVDLAVRVVRPAGAPATETARALPHRRGADGRR